MLNILRIEGRLAPSSHGLKQVKDTGLESWAWKDLLRKLQINMMTPRTTLKQIPIRSRLLYHLRMHRISPPKLILPPIIGLYQASDEGLLIGIGGRSGEFVGGEREG